MSAILFPSMLLVETRAISQFKPLPPLQPLPPLEAKRRRTRRLISWATLIAIASAIAFGVLHGLGVKIADEAWPLIKSLVESPKSKTP